MTAISLKQRGAHFAEAIRRRQWTTGSGLLRLHNLAIRSGLPTILTDTIVTAPTITEGLTNLLFYAPYTSVTDATELLSADLPGVFVPRKNSFTTLDTGADHQDAVDVDCVHGARVERGERVFPRHVLGRRGGRR
ncbi:hypothetical protein PLESTF_001705900 [Pleodorina starrii]|nr:hypothetical protein PLESTM_001400200 [Pleodorina starrii]GLC42917.1 hypothetical protein PLESTM_001400300 [Pleodorina starrii]GLC75918.1 hypothetical protein PLESTF_001705900 [Pleodorina starrii]